MRVATIARELGAISAKQEEELCASLGLRCVNKAALEKRFEEMGVNGKFLRRFDERKPNATFLLGGADIYWETLRKAVLQEAVRGDAAIIGRGANFLLGEIFNCARLRLAAPFEFRVRRIASERMISFEEAGECVRASDREKIGFCRHHYRKDWHDVACYDLTANAAEFDLRELKELFEKILVWKAPAPESLRRLNDALVVQSARCAIFLSAETLEFRYLSIECEDGNVVLRGSTPTRGMAERIKNIVKEVEGVRRVENLMEAVFNEIPKRIE